MLEKNKNKSDLTTVIFGFSFILVISAIFFLKFHFFDQKNATELADKTNETAKQELNNFSSITATDLAKKIQAKEKMTILDARDPGSFKTEHILDSKNFSLDGLTQKISSLEKDREYFFVDDFGLTPNEIQAMKFFKDNGLMKTAYLEGGLTQWKNEYEPTINIGNPASLPDRAKVSFVTSDDLKGELTSTKPPYIVDTRSASEYQRGHIVNAVNIPLDDLESRRHEIPSGAKIVFYDNTGLGAFQGAVRLFDAGILNVYALSDGLKTWQQKGFEIVPSK